MNASQASNNTIDNAKSRGRFLGWARLTGVSRIAALALVLPLEGW
jgi:hypothetical protein